MKLSSALVEVPQRSAHGLVVHVGLVLVFTPQLGHGLGVNQLEDALLPLHPLDVPGAGVLVLQQLQQELPQVGGVAWRQETQGHTVNSCSTNKKIARL